MTKEIATYRDAPRKIYQPKGKLGRLWEWFLDKLLNADCAAKGCDIRMRKIDMMSHPLIIPMSAEYYVCPSCNRKIWDQVLLGKMMLVNNLNRNKE